MTALFALLFSLWMWPIFEMLWFKFSDQVTSLTKQNLLPQRFCRGKMEVFQELKEVTLTSPGNISVSGGRRFGLYIKSERKSGQDAEPNLHPRIEQHQRTENSICCFYYMYPYK